MLHLLHKFIFLTMLATFLTTNAFSGEVALEGAEVGQWTMDYDAALKLASQKKLPMLLNFTGSDWCGWCKLMDRKVFSTQSWKGFAKEEIVLVTLDFPRNKSIVPAKYTQRNYRLQSKFGVQGYPVFIILDEDGETVLGQLGAGRDKSAEIFIKEVESITNFRETELEKKATRLKGNQLQTYRSTVAVFKNVLNDFDGWLATEPTRTEDNMTIYRDYLSRLGKIKEQIAQF